MTQANVRPVQAAKLRGFVSKVLQAYETPPADADFVAEILVEADLRGVDSHGVTRLSGYVGMLDRGYINPLPTIKVVSEDAACTVLEGDLAFGMLVARKGMEMSLQRAKEHGMGMTISRNMTHTGLVGYYTMTAASQGFIGIAMNNGPVIVPPYGSITPLYATNPMSVAFPADKEEPIVLDMATSMVAAGKLRLVEKTGNRVPMDWGVDRHGKPTDDPTEILQHGYLQWAGGYKGFGLATMIETLTAVLSGGLFGRQSPTLKHFGQDPLMQSGAYIAIDISRFMPLEMFKGRVDELVRMINDSEPADGHERVYVSGAPEFAFKRERVANGIPMPTPVYEELRALGERFSVPLDLD
ncbi:MAG: Ldh family oxidoreductase [Dehalococcoidia bacterium]